MDYFPPQGTPDITLRVGHRKHSYSRRHKRYKRKNVKLNVFDVRGHKGTLSRTFFGFFSKTAPNLRLSTFNHAGNAPRTSKEGYLANCLKKMVTVNSFRQFFQTTRTELEKVRLTLSLYQVEIKSSRWYQSDITLYLASVHWYSNFKKT